MLLGLALFLFLPLPTLVAPPPKWRRIACGGALTAQRGTIATPNFPHAFRTPIHCRWHIDARRAATAAAAANASSLSVKIYLTQVYVQEGLEVVEYDSKDAYDYRLQGRRVFALTEDAAATSNATYIYVDKEYVVVDFRLERSESAHLRVLDGLLNVYGFNVTYEITAGRERPHRCSMKLCGFTGYCYDDFVHFRCECFPGFRGRRCSVGPKSKCVVNGQPSCENGAECLHTGHTAFICDCRPGFHGAFCELRDEDLAPTAGCGGDPECLTSCKFNGTMEDVCQCAGKPSNNRAVINESVGYSSRIFVQSKLSPKELQDALKQNMLDTLRVNISGIDDVNIISSTTANNETDVTLRFYAPKQQDELVRSAIRTWGRTPNARYVLAEKDVHVRTDPHVHLEHVAVDKAGAVAEGEAFVLSCTARGSRSMIFRWFMDGHLVNLTRASRSKWEELVARARDRYAALLVVQKATRFDRGRFTCHVEDYGVQQCRSLRVEMHFRPQVRLEPASLTVDKGAPFTIKCISLAQAGEKYRFSWTKDRHLLPIRTASERYEILYPGGSILQVGGLNKTTSYSCLAHLDKLSAEVQVVVHVVDALATRACASERRDALDWPTTATGADCRRECPDGYYGVATRTCIMLENGAPRWLPPDYANCTRADLVRHLRDFRYLEEGYARTTPLRTLRAVWRYVADATLLSGEGRVLLDVVERVARFNNASFGYSDREGVCDLVLDIVDAILSQNVSLNKEQQVVTLQQLVKEQLMTLAPQIKNGYRKILPNLQASIEVDSSTLGQSKRIRVDYRNLYEFLTKKSVIRLNYGDDREMKYELFAGVTSIWRLEPTVPTSRKTISAVFHRRFPPATSANVVRCALAAYAASDYAWNAAACRVVDANASSVACECDDEGAMTMLLLLVEEARARSTSFATKSLDEVARVGCGACGATCAAAGVLLVVGWLRRRSTMAFLRAQCALSLTACMLCFVVGFSDGVAERFYPHVLSALLASYLTALSSQLSTLLIVYADLIDARATASVRPAVVGIVSGAPVIAVVANHLAHAVRAVAPTHWWIVGDALSFYVFGACVATVGVLYAILCCLVGKLIRTDKTKSDKMLSARSTTMTRSTLIFATITISAGASLACVNRPEEVVWQYAFAATSIFMGVLVMLCLVFKVRAASRKHFWEWIHRGNSGGGDKTHQHQKDAKPHHVSHNKCERESESRDVEERDAASPTRRNSSAIAASSATMPPSNATLHQLNSPDILGAQAFAELDLVATASSVADVANDEQPVANQRSKRDKCVKFCDQVASDKPALDEVMNGISNDLRYLLDGRQFGEPTNTISC